MSDAIRKMMLLTITILLFKPFEGISQYVYTDDNLQQQLNQARDDVYNEKFGDAVAKYAELVKKNDNKTVSAEYAYALALTGCYDGAIMNLDKIIANGQIDKDVLFYTSQVLKLMEYDSIAKLFWTFSYSKMSFAPSWISRQYQSFVEKFHYPAMINTDDLGTALQRANKLADRKQYIQSMVLFLELTETYPNHYLPYIGLSALLENLGFKQKAIDYLQRGLDKMGENRDKFDPDDDYYDHLKDLKDDNVTDELSLSSGKPKSKNGRTNKSFSYYGISYVNNTLAARWKYGWYTSKNSFIATGFSYCYYNNTNVFSADFSFNGKIGILVLGVDLSLQRTGTSWGVGAGPCLGLSIPIAKGKSSFDLLEGINVYLQTDSPTNMNFTISSSIGFTHYF